jgi:hypothetical protein
MRPSVRFVLFGILCALFGSACGASTGLVENDVDGGDARTPEPETCNGVDDDLDGTVDEDFRDEAGRYVGDGHCGACGALCTPDVVPNATSVSCALLEGTPVCAAVECSTGTARSSTGKCVPIGTYACLPCFESADCGDLEGAVCANVAGESRCAVRCELGCPGGYRCGEDDLCVPESGSCSCTPASDFDLACPLVDPEGGICPGTATCRDGAESECAAPTEVCDEVDNDCNGVIDDGFRDGRGAYSLDIRNCGRCGVDCTANPVPEGDLVCGGDPFAPSCVLLCPDAVDGVMPGDRIDGDRNIATGCECLVSSLSDEAGPVRTTGEALDVNCDGADGIVIESFYVAPSGSDRDVGSPTRPLRTIGEGLRRAAASLNTAERRPHVFVASGNYAETIDIPGGVKLHGGYRSDFLALDPSGFRVEVRAPASTTAPGGAALTATDTRAAEGETLVEWIVLRGVDAEAAGGAAFGAVLSGANNRLVLRDLEIYAGVGGPGVSGVDGTQGAAPSRAATRGAIPRAAMEGRDGTCLASMANVVEGGSGGANRCDGIDVSGGIGASATCPAPDIGARQRGGERGASAAPASGGSGGNGGNDIYGPTVGPPCPSAVCCGLADFSVPTDYSEAVPGQPGASGRIGTAGRGCTDPLGTFSGTTWSPAPATRGTSGTPGAGGGGGGAGGSSRFDSVAPTCVFADGLGGGGGGGGAGGCGGTSGTPGTSGGPSIAVVLTRTGGSARAPTLANVLLVSSNGGRGGDGGAGGDGGFGDVGGEGGSIPRAERTTPTLSGPTAGGAGGRGGNGGAGGGAGGGCGGPSGGVWVVDGVAMDEFVVELRANNRFTLGNGGAAGRGGGGAAAAADGIAGEAIDVITR